MNKKIISIIALVLLLLSVFTSINSSEVPSKYERSNSVFLLGSHVNVTFDSDKISEPIMPESGIKSFTINLFYTTGYDAPILRFFAKLFKNKEMDINLNVQSTPDWCKASFKDETLTAKVNVEGETLTTDLNVEVLKNAKAYESGKIEFSVSVDPVMGPFGVFLHIAGFKEDFEVDITPAFLAEIDAEIDYLNYTETDIIEISPYKEIDIPISILNLGNDKTKVLAEITDSPENWTLDIDSYVIIDMNASDQFELSVKADHKFEDETITVQLTPVRVDDTTDEGESTNIVINLHNDGSYKEPEEELEIDTTMLAVILLAIILVIIILVVFIKRR